MRQAIANSQPIVYDATNAQQIHRRAIVKRIQALHAHIAVYGWQLRTALEVCQHRNHNRDRCVPDGIIQQMHDALCDVPPQLGEGFLHLSDVSQTSDSQTDFVEIDRLINHWQDLRKGVEGSSV